MKKKLLYLIALIPVLTFSQKKPVIYHGVVKDSIDVVKNAHIINLSTKNGTFSNDIGEYKIPATIGDTLQFSSVQHETLFQVITSADSALNITLTIKSYPLDPIQIKRNRLSGFLSADVKQTPKDKRQSAVNNMMKSINNMNLSYQEYGADETHMRKVNVRTDPTRGFKGFGTVIGIGGGKIKKQKRKALEKDRYTIEKMKKFLGEQFLNELNIPKDHHYRFLFFCEKFEIKKLYKKKLLMLIKVLEEKSKEYLKLIPKE